MEPEQRERFQEALDRKHEEAERKGQANQPHAGSAPPEAEVARDQTPIGTDRVQDDFSIRDKNTGHKKKTADKWNQ